MKSRSAFPVDSVKGPVPDGSSGFAQNRRPGKSSDGPISEARRSSNIILGANDIYGTRPFECNNVYEKILRCQKVMMK